ncbi:metallophosphoesterase [Phycicoccus sp. HDW14]|uniref:metallophosphoesterase n=1 Tax=Phycicoccus sp. HDW14 TaxID=2714941 RepID=UPI001F0EE8DF|nr:metallophosphoesterase [Phycicoccus sp. HDW14]
MQLDGARVALLTDLHAGAVRSSGFTRRVVDLVNAQRPDVVLIAGDLVDGYAERYAQEIAPLADLEAPLGVFVTTGNHEMYRDTANWVSAFEDLGLTVLKNSAVPLERDGASITLAGVHDYSGGGAFVPDYDAALDGTDPAGYTLLMAHQPRQVLAVEGRGVDLQVSGHTHGGQMWPLRHLVPLQQPMVDGLATVGDVPVVTSRGAGAWGPAIRVLAPPEVPIITLRRG